MRITLQKDFENRFLSLIFSEFISFLLSFEGGIFNGLKKTKLLFAQQRLVIKLSYLLGFRIFLLLALTFVATKENFIVNGIFKVFLVTEFMRV